MALQFILGPARSGKTTYIYDRIIRESMEKPDQEFFLLVPITMVNKMMEDQIDRWSR